MRAGDDHGAIVLSCPHATIEAGFLHCALLPRQVFARPFPCATCRRQWGTGFPCAANLPPILIELGATPAAAPPCADVAARPSSAAPLAPLHGPPRPQPPKLPPLVRTECYYLGPVLERESCRCPSRHLRRCEHPGLSPYVPTTTLRACESCPAWEKI